MHAAHDPAHAGGHPAPREAAGSGGSGEDFPRLATATLLRAAEVERRGRQRLVAWTIGLGLGALALGLPSERLWGQASFLPADAAGYVPLGRWLRLLAGWLGTSAERAWFLASAAAFALCVPSFDALAARFDLESGQRAPIGITLLAAPLVLVAARLPLPWVPGMLGAFWVLSLALARDQRVGWPRAVGVLLLAGGMHPQNLLLAPALAISRLGVRQAAQRSPGTLRRGWSGIGLLFLAAVLWIPFPLGDAARHARGLTRVVLGGEGGGPGQMVVGFALLALGLGALAPWLFGLLFAERASEESPPPRWVHVALAAAAVPWIMGNPAAGPIAPWLPVLAAIGGLDRAVRGVAPVRAERGVAPVRAERGTAPVAMQHGVEDEPVGWRCACTQLALGLALALAFEATDPDRAWRASARAFLERGDLVLTTRADRAYLLSERWGLDVMRIPPLLGEGEGEGFPARPPGHARVVLDGAPSGFPSLVRERARSWGAVELPRAAGGE